MATSQKLMAAPPSWPGCQGLVDGLAGAFAQALVPLGKPDKNMGVEEQHQSASQ